VDFIINGFLIAASLGIVAGLYGLLFAERVSAWVDRKFGHLQPASDGKEELPAHAPGLNCPHCGQPLCGQLTLTPAASPAQGNVSAPR
jgi:hypothetical protein